jgi:NTE family protein
MSIDKLRSGYFQLLSDDNIRFVYPTVKLDPRSSFYKLYLDVSRTKRFTVGFGGNVSSSAASAAYIGLAYRWFGKVALELSGNAYFGRFYSSGYGALRTDFAAALPVYLKVAFTYNHKDYFKNSIYFFEDNEPSYLIQNESFVSFELGLPATSAGKFTNGYAWGYTKDDYYQTNNFTKQDTADITRFEFFTVNVGFEMNSHDKKQYATKGAALLLKLKYIQGIEKTMFGSTSENSGEEIVDNHNWFQFRLKYDSYFRKFGFFTPGFYGELLLSNQSLFSNYTSTILRSPAFEPIPEMKTLFLPKYRSHNYATIGLKGIFDVYKNIDIRIEGYLFQPYEELTSGEDGSAEKRNELSYRSTVLAGTVVYHSPIGPISLAFNYLDRAEDQFSVFFNIGYIIFNKGVVD